MPSPCYFARYRAGLLVVGTLLSLAATGQVIRPDPGGESCVVTPKSEPYRYEFLPGAGQTFRHWQVRGDLKLLTPVTDNPAVICSEGYGKGRITAHYYSLRSHTGEKCWSVCPDTVYHTLDYELFKQFKAPGPLNGPACARPGEEVTYSVAPVLTDWAHRNDGIGTDGYYWSGFPTGTLLRFSGDSSSVTAVLPGNLASGFTVAVQVGRCNRNTPLGRAVGLGQTLAAAVSGPDCPTVGGASHLTITVATLAGTTYSVSLPAGWRFANASTGTLTGDGQAQAMYFELGSTPGNVLLTATGGCAGPQTMGWSFTWQP
ncbi:MAG: hypothetical protein H7330_17280 [Hymenobacteraceae bacterium]|nr:hypothetical protein [Hymenobacteraceae bacterium]